MDRMFAPNQQIAREAEGSHHEPMGFLDKYLRKLKSKKGNLEQASISSPNSASFIKKAHELRGAEATSESEPAAQARDDSVVYSETPNKKHGAKLKSQRRGHSFNLKNNGPANTWQPPDGEASVPPTAKRKWSFKRLGFGTSKRSSSHDVSKDSPGAPQLVNYADTASPVPNPVQRSQTLPSGMHSQTSPNTLTYQHNFGAGDGGHGILSDPPMAAQHNDALSWQNTSSSPMVSQSTSSLEYTHNSPSHNGYDGKENEQPKEYKSVFEYRMAQINKSYSSSGLRSPSIDNFSSPGQDSVTSPSRDVNRRPWRANQNYEKNSSVEAQRSYVQNFNNSTPSYSNSDQVNNNNQNVNTRNFQSQDDGNLGGISVTPASSGLRYSHSMSHVEKPNIVPSTDYSSPSKMSHNNRTNSWTENNSTPSSIEKQRKISFPSRINAHMDDKVKSKDAKRHLQEMRMRNSPKDSPTRQPMIVKREGLGDAVKTAFSFDEATTREYVTKEASPVKKRVKDTGTGPSHGPKSPTPVLTPPKRLNTGSKLSKKSTSSSKESSIIDEHKWDVVQTGGANYMYIVRQKPCYNTSTQTETVETAPMSPTMADMNLSPAPVAKEERGIQARPGSIVAATLGNVDNSAAASSGQLDPAAEQAVSAAAEKRNMSVSSESSDTRSPSTPRYWINEDDIAKINENPNQSDMLRKLSQEYFGQRRFSGSNKNLSKIIGSSSSTTTEETKQRRKSAEMDSRMGPQLTLMQSEYETKSHNFEGPSRNNMPQSGQSDNSRAIDIIEDVRSSDKRSTNKGKHGKSNSASHTTAFKQYNVSHQSYASYDSQQQTDITPQHVSKTTDNIDLFNNANNTSLNTREIAEKARMDYIKSGAFQKNGGAPRTLQRTVSEQIRPFEDRNRNHVSNEKMQVTKDMRNHPDHRHLASDPSSVISADVSSSPNSKVMLRQHRLMSDSEISPLRNSVGTSRNYTDARGHRISLARSSSSGSGHSREEDGHELRRLQQKALLSFYEKKTGKRASTSSMDSSYCNESMTGTTPKSEIINATSPDWRRKASLKNSQDYPSRRSSSGASGYDSLRSVSIRDGNDRSEMSPLPVLDTQMASVAKDRGYHSHTSSGATTASSLSPRGDPYSPPLHPWPSNEMPKLSEEEQLSPDTIKQDKDESSEDDVTELKSKYKATLALEGAVKSVQYSTSSNESTTPGAMGPENNRFTYNLGPNMNHQPDETIEESDMSPPVLPPRNYRHLQNALTTSARQVPQPQEPPLTGAPAGSQTRGDRSSSGNNAPQPDSQRSSSSSFHDVFTTDYDQTPERDSYADQLRQQSRRISQSQSAFINHARGGYHGNMAAVTTTKPEVQQPPSQQQKSMHRSGPSDSSIRSNSATSPSWTDSDSRYSQSELVSGSGGGGASANRGGGGASANRRSGLDTVMSHQQHNSPQHSDVTRHHHSPQQSVSNDVTRMGGARNSPSFTSSARLSPHHSPQQSIASDHSRSSSSSHGSRGSSRHSPQASFTSDRSAGPYHSPQASYSSDVSRGLRHSPVPPMHHQQMGDNRGYHMGDNRGHHQSKPHSRHNSQNSNTSGNRDSIGEFPQQQKRDSYSSKQRDSLNTTPTQMLQPQHQRKDSTHNRPSPMVDYSYSDVNELPPPPPPHHRLSPNLAEESKPLPPAPPPEADMSDEQRFSGDSYLPNKSNYRQGFGGNYHRNGEVSPPSNVTSQRSNKSKTQETTNSPNTSISNQSDTSMIQLSTKMSATSKQNTIGKANENPGLTGSAHHSPLVSGVSEQQAREPAWRQHRGTPMRPPMDMRLRSQNLDMGTPTHQQKSAINEEAGEPADSPSVKDVLAKFEKQGGEKKRKQKSVSKSKVQGLRDNILSRSSENICDSVTFPEGKRSRSGSTENLLGESGTPSRYERLYSSPIQTRKKRTHSEENLVDSVPIAPEVPSPTHKVHNNNKTVNPPPPTSAISSDSNSNTSQETLRAVTPERLDSGPIITGHNVNVRNNNHTKPVTTNSGHNMSIENKMADHSQTHDVTRGNTQQNTADISMVTHNDNLSHNNLQNQSFQSQQHHHKHTDSSQSDSQSDIRSNDSGVLEDIAHVRHKTQEEVECERQAAYVASHLGDKDKALSNVLVPPPDHKTTTDYITGLFDTRGVNIHRKPSLLTSAGKPEVTNNRKRPSTLPTGDDTANKVDPALPLPPTSPYWTAPSLAHLQNKMREDGVSTDEILQDVNSNGGSMDGQKETLIGRIEKKLEILREEKEMLAEEIAENDNLGEVVTNLVEEKVENDAELKKYSLYVTELDKVICLLLNVSGRLARAENAVSSLAQEASNKEKRAVKAKRDELLEKLDDAKQLKEGIDRRSKQVSLFLRKYLQPQEFEDYEHFIKMKSKLTVDQQDIEDKLKLGEEQLSALRKSLTQSTC